LVGGSDGYGHLLALRSLRKGDGFPLIPVPFLSLIKFPVPSFRFIRDFFPTFFLMSPLQPPCLKDKRPLVSVLDLHVYSASTGPTVCLFFSPHATSSMCIFFTISRKRFLVHCLRIAFLPPIVRILPVAFSPLSASFLQSFSWCPRALFRRDLHLLAVQLNAPPGILLLSLI